MHRSALSACAFLLIAGLAFASHAADRKETVRFAKGHTSATVKGAIHGDDGVVYELGAAQGQTMSVRFRPSGGSCYFNVLPPDGGEALFVGSISGDTFEAVLDRSGTYAVQVYLMRSAARRNETCTYSIAFEIRGAAAAKPVAAPNAGAH